MSDYVAPLKDMQFVLKELAGLDQVVKLPGCEDASAELVDQILEESGKFCAEVLAPLNQSGDEEGSKWDNGRVTTPKGFIEAYKQFVEGGWNALQFPPEFGGQGLPKLVATPVMEMWKAANLSFSLCPLLTGGAIEALLLRGADALKKTYLPKMVEGTWTGTMNLTESQAGSDLALVKAKAVRQSDERLGEHYRIFGQKIFITYGEHDLAENIIHLVLARTPDAPEGVKGISLFIVPKILVNADGSLGERNDVSLAGLNHKMGNRGTTNCLLNFGEGKFKPGGSAGAVGNLVGEPNRGLANMFHMMNEARIGVGMGAVLLGYTGYLHSLDYARSRPQGRHPAAKDPASPQVPIIEHADVRRMLLAQKSYVEGGLALRLYCARLVDEQKTGESEAARKEAGLLLDILTPIAKSWPSQWCLGANSLAIQVHGGYGYTRDYKVEQFYRDNRLNPIHEGTHGIQAMDLLGRKVGMERGRAFELLLARMGETAAEAQASESKLLHQFGEALNAAMAQAGITTRQLLSGRDPNLMLANASVYLEMLGHVVIAWVWLRQAALAQRARATAPGADA